jgi:hypothetical protein
MLCRLFFYLQTIPNPMKISCANLQLNYVVDFQLKAYLFEAGIFYYDITDTRGKSVNRLPSPRPSPRRSPQQ